MNPVISVRYGIILVLLSLFASIAHAATPVQPGTTVVLRSDMLNNPADGTDASCGIFPINLPAVTTTCGTDQMGQQFGVRAFASQSFNRGQGTASQFYEIDVDPGDGSETPLLAQISGKTNLNGFLALVGGGQVKGSLTFKVIDLGPSDNIDYTGGKVVHRETLSSHQLQGAAITGLNFGISVEGGAPYIGMGAQPEFKVNIMLQKELVRDTIDFGVHVLLLRGHTYRLQFDTSVLAKKEAVPGLSIAQFKLGDDRAPNMLDPENWLDGIDGIIDTRLPAITAQPVEILQERALKDNVFQIFNRQRRLLGTPGFANSLDFLNKRAAAAGLPTSLREIVVQRLNKSNLLTEGIAKPGTEIRELSVTLQTDQVEILRQHTELLNRIIDLQNTPQGRRPGFPRQ